MHGTMRSLRPSRQQSLPVLPKYRTLMQDVEERGQLQLFSRNICRVAVEHLRTEIPGQVSFGDLCAFLKKEVSFILSTAPPRTPAISPLFFCHLVNYYLFRRFMSSHPVLFPL